MLVRKFNMQHKSFSLVFVSLYMYIMPATVVSFGLIIVKKKKKEKKKGAVKVHNVEKLTTKKSFFNQLDNWWITLINCHTDLTNRHQQSGAILGLSVWKLELGEGSGLHLALFSDPLGDRHGTENLLNGAWSCTPPSTLLAPKNFGQCMRACLLCSYFLQEETITRIKRSHSRTWVQKVNQQLCWSEELTL